MQLAKCSFAAIIAIIAIATFGLGRNSSLGQPRPIAPDAQAAVARDPLANRPDDGKSLEQRLNERIDLSVVEMPLKELVELLHQQTGIQFGLSAKKLEDAGVSVDATITRNLRQIRVSTLLDFILGELELAYVEKDGLLLITTPEDAESMLQIRVYNCRDLFALEAPKTPEKASSVPAPPSVAANTPASTGSAPARPSATAAAQPAAAPPAGRSDSSSKGLIALVVSSVAPHSWDEVGGPGSISEYNGLVVVSQTVETHKQVERLFDMLREAAGLEVPKTGKVVR